MRVKILRRVYSSLLNVRGCRLAAAVCAVLQPEFKDGTDRYPWSCTTTALPCNPRPGSGPAAAAAQRISCCFYVHPASGRKDSLSSSHSTHPVQNTVLYYPNTKNSYFSPEIVHMNKNKAAEVDIVCVGGGGGKNLSWPENCEPRNIRPG